VTKGDWKEGRGRRHSPSTFGKCALLGIKGDLHEMNRRSKKGKKNYLGSRSEAGFLGFLSLLKEGVDCRSVSRQQWSGMVGNGHPHDLVASVGYRIHLPYKYVDKWLGGDGFGAQVCGQFGLLIGNVRQEETSPRPSSFRMLSYAPFV
jgi:hypothetical protein